MRLNIKGRWKLMVGDCLQRMKDLPDNSVDSVVCDPPYGLSKEPDIVEVLQHWLAGDDYTHKGNGFMGKTWDSFVPGPAVWREALRVLKPGGYLIAFFGTRTYDLGTIAIRMAGFRVRDQLAWTYGSGFPKSQNVANMIDKIKGAKPSLTGKAKPGHEGFVNRGVSSVQSFKGTMGGKGGFSRPWMDDPDAVARYHMETEPGSKEGRKYKGYGTALKPAWEPICLAQKPFKGTIAKNVLEHGVGALNVDACRVQSKPRKTGTVTTGDGKTGSGSTITGSSRDRQIAYDAQNLGRFPANLIHDGSDEVTLAFPITHGAGTARKGANAPRQQNWNENVNNAPSKRSTGDMHRFGDEGSAARFFYVAKPSKSERNAAIKNDHPTVKPVALMEHLVQLVTPTGGVVLDPFFGSGTTGVAALNKGFRVIGCEQSKDYAAIAAARLKAASASQPAIPIKGKRRAVEVTTRTKARPKSTRKRAA